MPRVGANANDGDYQDSARISLRPSRPGAGRRVACPIDSVPFAKGVSAMNLPATCQTDIPRLEDSTTAGEARDRAPCRARVRRQAGTSANLVVAGLAERAGTTFRFVEFLQVVFPLMLISIALSHVYLYYRFL